MLLRARASGHAFRAHNYDDPPPTTGTALGTSHTSGNQTKPSYTEIIPAADVDFDVYAIFVRIQTFFTSASARFGVVHIGYDPGGGYRDAMSPAFFLGAPGTVGNSKGHHYCIPVFIPAGSAIGIAIAGNAAQSCKVCMEIRGKKSSPLGMPVGRFSEGIGISGAYDATAFTPGNTVWGSWVSLGTTVRPLWWWQLGWGVNNNAMTNFTTHYIQAAWGDASNKHIIKQAYAIPTSTETTGDVWATNRNAAECFCPVPGGATIYVRGMCSEAPDSGFRAAMVGIGG